MIKATYIILGGTGFIGSAVCSYLEREGESVISVDSRNYSNYIGAKADVLINCNGNTFRYRANQYPCWDFDANVVTVERSLFDFRANLYIHISTVDVYNVLNDPDCNHEGYQIQPEKLEIYGFHKWLAERLVEKFTERSVILRVGSAIGNGLKKGPLYDLLNTKSLHMSLDSELTLIDTPTIARAISAIIATGPAREIINLTGNGSAKLRDLLSMIPTKIKFAGGAENLIHRYNINNTKMQEIMPIPTSIEVAKNFLKDHTRRLL